MSRRYVVLDVFTDRPLVGNPLAVVLDCEGLSDAAMQAIAREFNLSETVFVLPAAKPIHSARVRIFTPGGELPFAGHPTIGTAVLLAREAAPDGPGPHEKVLVLEEKVGPVRCGVTTEGDGGHAIFDLPRLAAATDGIGDKEAIAAALGLMPAEIGFENHRPSGFEAGVPYAFVPIRDLGAIGKARADVAGWKAAFSDTTVGAYLYCRETVAKGRHFHARMFAPGHGIAEDPATGSAAAAFAGVIHRFDQPPGGSHHYVIEQGFEMKRPSLIGLEIDVDDGRIVAGRVGGDAVVVAEGALFA